MSLYAVDVNLSDNYPHLPEPAMKEAERLCNVSDISLCSASDISSMSTLVKLYHYILICLPSHSCICDTQGLLSLVVTTRRRRE